MEPRINKMENVYFIAKAIFTVIVLLVAVFAVSSLFAAHNISMISTSVVFVVYAIMIWVFIIFQKIYLVAYLKGNGISISERQFPEVYSAYIEMARKLNINKPPKLFIIQEGGFLNAFAIRFSGKNYIAIYSEVMALIESDINTVKFVLAHELGHVKRNHMSKRFWTFPSSIIPFLTAAYSRRCEYTCDNIGIFLSPDCNEDGLLVLAAGSQLYKKIDKQSYIEEANANYSMSVKSMQLFMSHPYLPKRIANISKSK